MPDALESLDACANPVCFRLAPLDAAEQATYCCGACLCAGELTDISPHTPVCDQREEDRRTHRRAP